MREPVTITWLFDGEAWFAAVGGGVAVGWPGGGGLAACASAVAGKAIKPAIATPAKRVLRLQPMVHP
jgi:hypothetical protein